MIMKSKDKKIWIELYDVANEIYKLKPWEKLWDSDLFMCLSETGDMYYFCTMGKAGIHKGINVYKNDEILTFMDM